ncbi:hypothetical protein L596_025426 [Steinernema carpocapsae]|uniref:Uncharacterized protein n=1 Tax=Steinernema carpocapsae TaxID=34508 RepID=A0A4U5M7R0_STECR|nr:hypothetical protein L596_025426 [Steinernema carpocapsae]
MSLTKSGKQAHVFLFQARNLKASNSFNRRTAKSGKHKILTKTQQNGNKWANRFSCAKRETRLGPTTPNILAILDPNGEPMGPTEIGHAAHRTAMADDDMRVVVAERYYLPSHRHPLGVLVVLFFEPMTKS